MHVRDWFSSAGVYLLQHIGSYVPRELGGDTTKGIANLYLQDINDNVTPGFLAHCCRLRF